MRKLLAESLSDYLHEREIFKGQVDTGLSLEDIDKKEFLVGLAVEKVHSENLAVQKQLVFQNLNKNPKYYSEGMKKGMFDDVAAINTYKKYFIDKEEPEEKEEKVKESLNEELRDELITTILKNAKDKSPKEVEELRNDLSFMPLSDLDKMAGDYYLYDIEREKKNKE
jgi:hypothetical protein